jgi:large subunit ribosomal protein L28
VGRTLPSTSLRACLSAAFGLEFDFDFRKRFKCDQDNVKGGGQECPPHTNWQNRLDSDKISLRGSVPTHLEQFMAHVCDICGKGPQFGNNISHAHNVTKRRWNVNLRPVHAKVGAATRRIRVCTSCLRSGKVVKA